MAKGDEFCSTYCAKRNHGTLGYEPSHETALLARRIKYHMDKHGGAKSIDVENTDAMTRLVPGSYEGGKKR